MALGIIGIVVAILLFNIISYKGWDLVAVAILAAIVVALFNKLPVFSSITDTFMAGGASTLKMLWFVFFGATFFAGLYSAGGGADSIAHAILRLFARKGTEGARGVHVVCLTSFVVFILLTYGGIDAMACQMALLPILMSMCREVNLPRRIMPVLLMCTYCCGTLPFAANTSIAICMGLMNNQGDGTPDIWAGTAWPACLISCIICFVIGYFYIYTSARKYQKKGIGFEELPGAPEFKADVKRPHWALCLIPLVVTFCLFMFVHLHIGFSMIAGGIVSAIIFFPYFKKQPGCEGMSTFKIMQKTIKERVQLTAELTICVFAVVGFGSVIMSTEAYMAIIGGVLSTANGSPWICGLVIAITVGCLANVMAGMQIGIPMVAPTLMAQGLAKGAILRICQAACSTFDSLPVSIGVQAAHRLAGVSLKEGYKHVAVITVFMPIVNTALLCLLYTIAPALFNIGLIPTA
jgi:H+/gluconate symporter-like permease